MNTQQIINHIHETSNKSALNRRRRQRGQGLEDTCKLGLKVIACATAFLFLLILITALSGQ